MASDRKRKGLSKKTRFEVFKRDSFTCQYCGKSAPEVVLQCDHISPVAKGGDDDPMNLVTSCEACNGGKSDRALDDSSVIAKQRAQLQELNERREQLEMMLQWREGLQTFNDEVVDKACEYWEQKAAPFVVTEVGREKFAALIKSVGLGHVLDAVDTATKAYVKRNLDGTPTDDSVCIAFDKMMAIAKVNYADVKNPGTKDKAYIRGILKNRVGYVNDRSYAEHMAAALKAGVEIEHIKSLAKQVGSWTQFRTQLEEWTQEAIDEAQDF